MNDKSQIYKKKYNLREQIKLFEANSIFYSSMKKRTKIIAAVCFVRFIEQKSIEYFGYYIGFNKIIIF